MQQGDQVAVGALQNGVEADVGHQESHVRIKACRVVPTLTVADDDIDVGVVIRPA
jgi:hypothetical protein